MQTHSPLGDTKIFTALHALRTGRNARRSDQNVGEAMTTLANGDVKMPADEFESRLTASYLLGIAAATETLEHEFNKNAGECYATRQDDRAKFFRELATVYKERGTVERTRATKFKTDQKLD